MTVARCFLKTFGEMSSTLVNMSDALFIYGVQKGKHLDQVRPSTL